MTLLLHTYSDGGARGNPGPAAIGVVICDARDHVLLEASHAIGEATNNQAEYQALLLALEMAASRKARRVVCYADSELLIFQCQGLYRVKDSKLKTLSEKVQSLMRRFDAVEFRQVPRSHPLIARADRLLNQTLNRGAARRRMAGSSRRSQDPGPHALIQQELF